LQAKGEQDCQQQNLQNVAFCERAKEGRGDDVEHEADGRLVLGLGDVTFDAFGIYGGGIDIHAGTRLQHVGDDEADDKGNGRHHLEIDERLDADPPDFLQVLHGCDAVHDGDENHRCDNHLDEFDEAVAQGLHGGTRLGPEMAEKDADGDGDEHLDVEVGVKRLARGNVDPGFEVGLHS